MEIYRRVYFKTDNGRSSACARCEYILYEIEIARRAPAGRPILAVRRK